MSKTYLETEVVDSVYWIWYASIFGYGTRRAKEVLERFPNPEELYSLTPAQLAATGGFREREMEALRHLSLDRAHHWKEQALSMGCDILTPDRVEYPERLRNICGAPLTLYVLGQLAGLEDRLAIGMVGSRKMSEYGHRVGDRLSKELAASGVVIVSGLAAGIDTVCHTGAIKAEGTTVGVLGCGIDVDYPKGSGMLRELMEKNGAVITEFPPGTPPLPRNFPVRNRIISGLSEGIVVIEGGEHSGTLVTAGHALSQDRDVFAVPGRIDDPNSTGCNKLLLQGAKPVTCAADILEEYRHRFSLEPLAGKELSPGEKQALYTFDVPEERLRSKRSAPDYLSSTQYSIYQLLDFEPISADAIADKLELPITRVLQSLTELEIYGLVKAKSGRSFCLDAQ